MIEQVPRHNRPMEIDVRRFEGDPKAFFEAGELAFSEHPHPEDVANWEKLFEPDRAIAAYDGDRVVGTAGSFSYDLSVPGGVLPGVSVTSSGGTIQGSRIPIINKRTVTTIAGNGELGGRDVHQHEVAVQDSRRPLGGEEGDLRL